MRLDLQSFPKVIYIFPLFIGVIIGVNSYYTNHTIFIKHYFDAIRAQPKEVFNNIFDKKLPLDTLSLFIDAKNFSKLEDNRKLRLATVNDFNFNHRKNNPSVNTKILHKGIFKDSKVKLLGYNKDHWGNPSKWSYRVKMKGFESYNRSKQFNLLIPSTRGYLFDYLINKISSDFGMISIKYHPLKIYLNGYDKGIYIYEDFFNKFLIERNNKKDSMIFVRNEKTKKISIKHPNYSNVTYDQEELISFLENNPDEFYELIDKKKLEICMAISYLFQSHHMILSGNLHWYYNPHSNSIEPIFREVFPVKPSGIFKNKCNKKSIVQFFNNRKAPEYFAKYLSNAYENNDFYNSYFLSLVMQVAEKFSFYLNTDQYENFHSILNNETIINNWVIMQGHKVVNDFLDQYNLNGYEKFDQNNERTKIDTIIYDGLININKTLIFNENEFILIKEGSKLNFKNNANLIINGGLEIRGTKSDSVGIYNSDSSKSSLLVLNASFNSLISYTNFYSLSSLSESFWKNTSAVTFYNSNVKISNSKFFKNVAGDDALNIVNTDHFSLDNCNFSNILSDAIDIDFSDGVIVNSTFSKIGNDAIDFSGSNSTVSNCLINSIGDKGVSAGEASKVIVEATSVSESKFGIVSKDLSEVISIGNSLNNNIYDFSAYNKKEEFGPAIIDDENSIGINTILLQEKSIVNAKGDELIFKNFNYSIIEN